MTAFHYGVYCGMALMVVLRFLVDIAFLIVKTVKQVRGR